LRVTFPHFSLAQLSYTAGQDGFYNTFSESTSPPCPSKGRDGNAGEAIDLEVRRMVQAAWEKAVSLIQVSPRWWTL
jgi:hypothetical protein